MNYYVKYCKSGIINIILNMSDRWMKYDVSLCNHTCIVNGWDGDGENVYETHTLDIEFDKDTMYYRIEEQEKDQIYIYFIPFNLLDVSYEGVAVKPTQTVSLNEVEQELRKDPELAEMMDEATVDIKNHFGLNKSSVDILTEVKSIQQQRAAEYEQDGGERSFAKIATIYNTLRGADLLPSDIALILCILKDVRAYSQNGLHMDSLIDKVSYSALWAELFIQERGGE